MNLKLLLFLMMFAGMLSAQQPNRSLVITEARKDAQNHNHVELTNMGNTPINLSEYKFVLMSPFIPQPVMNVFQDPWVPQGNRMFMLPDFVLEPGESYVITTAYDFGPKMYNMQVDGFEKEERIKQVEIYDQADFLIHVKEPRSGDYPHVKDSVTTSARYNDNYQAVWETWYGRGCWMIEHHFAPGDSAVVDQVGGVFDNNGRNFDRPYDVAGVMEATSNSLLIRKYSIKTGNLDFANARGVGQGDSEWIPIQRPQGYDFWRELWWTVGNHGPYVLDENTLESNVIDVDFAGKTLTVPWGVRRLDDIMCKMVKKPGVAWNYDLNPNRDDSLYYSARTGDKLTIYVVGSELQTAVFDIVVSEPTAGANIVVPRARVNLSSVAQGGPVRGNTQAGIKGIDWPRVTMHDHGTDTISGTWHGLPFAQRTDTLMKYLEKPANASWEFVFVDGITRPDLQHGDILKVTAENGNVKEYFIRMQPLSPSHDASLASISWPDIPDFYKGIFGWTGDTIPGFGPTVYNYRIEVPLDVDGIPALIAKPKDLNATVEVNRAISLTGSTQDRTAQFIITAQDDSVTNTYSVEMIKEKDPENLQPYHAEPFLSELVFLDQHANSFGEIANPGNQPLDLSNYMMVMMGFTEPASAIASRMGEEDWLARYDKYVPGYKWVSKSQWEITPGILEQDLNVNSIIQPGDVFTFGHIKADAATRISWDPTYVWPVPQQLDVQFGNYTGVASYSNPWGEPISGSGSPIGNWLNSSWYLFKILNDSIKLGLKPANDPNDFKLIEAFGMATSSTWVIGGTPARTITNWIRKPHIYQGNPMLQGSFGTNPDDTEWTWTNQAYWQARNYVHPFSQLNVSYDIGKHFMFEPSHYKSTVASVVYKVSPGYSMEEEIRGITSTTSVEDFLARLIKANPGQTLKVLTAAGAEKPMSAIMAVGDALVVTSADETNTSKYMLNVTERGLSSNAILTSTEYFISVEVTTGGIYNVPAGIKLSEVVANVTVPQGAVMTVVNGDDAWVPFTRVNFDSTYVDVVVSQEIYFEVVAENGTTKIRYQVVPMADPSDAYVLSDVYVVDQELGLIHFVPRGTEVSTFLRNLIPAPGATLKVVDKSGLQRTRGSLYQDDMLVATSQDGQVTKVYYLDMLRQQFVVTHYLAFVLSDDYMVDQLNKVIASPVAETPLAEFYAKLTPAFGATIAVYNKDGQLNSTGILNKGDVLVVTSADGRQTASYALTLDVTSIEQIESGLVSVYPNPTTGIVSISGVVAGSKVRVFNMMGAPVSEFISRSNIETISLENQASGIYFIVVSNNEKINGTYKVIKK
jgi:hypothetical protein